MNNALAVISVAAWVYLICARGRFWMCLISDQGEVRPDTSPEVWPSVLVIIPARNEASLIAESVGSLLRQDYLGPLTIMVVDDDSEDETASIVRAFQNSNRDLAVLMNQGPPRGWTGKLWALHQGIAATEATQPVYFLLTDADIVHAPDTLSWLVAKSHADGLVLASLMAKLRCRSFAERSHVPAFVYFFQMLFPFSRVCRADHATAAAAGGCVLVRADALQRAGGIASIRHALIDDCSLAEKLKAIGPIWLGLTDRVRSVRSYETFADVRQMVSRSAYAQLRYSPLLLVATLLAMGIIFIAPPFLTVFTTALPQYLGILVWLTMAVSFQPMLQFYQLSPLWGIALPAIALFYAFYTVASAYAHMRRRGGQWKGRFQATSASGAP